MKEFVLSELITNNIIKDVQNRFIQEHSLMFEYSHSGKEFHYFVQDCVNNGKMQESEVKEFLFDSLFYGYQRESYIYQVCTYNEEGLETKIIQESN